MVHRPLCFQKSPPPSFPHQNKTKQTKNKNKQTKKHRPSSHICVWLNLNKIDKYVTTADKQGNPSFHTFSCAALKTPIFIHSNNIGCSKIVPPSASVFYWLSHRASILSPKAKKRPFSHNSKCPKTRNTFFSLYFTPILITWPLVWPDHQVSQWPPLTGSATFSFAVSGGFEISALLCALLAYSLQFCIALLVFLPT